MTRAEYLAWAKQRALEYVDAGDLKGAFASIASDLNKHEETAGHPAIRLTLLLVASGHLNTQDEMRRHIEGFQ